MRAFDKVSSLCANHPNDWGKMCHMRMKDNHSGELIFHVEQAASGTRMDSASVAVLDIYWNHNFCVEFLEEMQMFCSLNDNIPTHNLWVMLTYVEMIAVARLLSSLYLSIVVPIC